MQLVERDYTILREVYRWRFCLGRHIRVLCNFQGARATDRRLKILVEAEYLERTKLLFGVPFIYKLTHKGRMLINVSKREDTIRLDQLMHDIAVLDTACYFKEIQGIETSHITSEKELHALDGFGIRKHHADFIYTAKGETVAVEVELSLKAKDRLEKNVKENYLNYDRQIWIVPKDKPKIFQLLKDYQMTYDNMEILSLEAVRGIESS